MATVIDLGFVEYALLPVEDFISIKYTNNSKLVVSDFQFDDTNIIVTDDCLTDKELFLQKSKTEQKIQLYDFTIEMVLDFSIVGIIDPFSYFYLLVFDSLKNKYLLLFEPIKLIETSEKTVEDARATIAIFATDISVKNNFKLINTIL